MTTWPLAGAPASTWPHRRGQAAVKRAVDLSVGLALLLVLSPLLAVLVLAVRTTSPGRGLFWQERVGRGGHRFRMCKLRTMRAGDDQRHRDFVQQMLICPDAGAGPDGVYKLSDDDRITPLGRVLRRTSLDELPQLLNVVRGEMSLVGPRPSLPWEAQLFGPQHQARFLVPPGMTGLWQVSGRSRESMSAALDHDVDYVARQSLRLDLAILLRTLPAVLRGDGAR
jgi:lipopolysaccharide/colanic/teichoic acid biosynthesis glycosyltransferase